MTLAKARMWPFWRALPVSDTPPISPHEESDEVPAELGFGKGGIPWYLMLFYIAFLAFFAWYVLEYQLPDYLEQGPIKPATPAIDSR